MTARVRAVDYRIEPQASSAPWLRSALFLPIALATITVAVFGEALLLPGDQVLSRPNGDIATQFMYWRQFGFDELRAGHIALRNPHVFSGGPFLAGFQAALLYPPNWIYLILPLAKAINGEIALHVFLLGLFMALWVDRSRLHPLAALFAGSVAMFSGTFFLQVMGGHLAELDSMAWVPLILLALDGLLEEPGAKWILVAILAVAMQFMAGHPQVVFSTVVTCGLYGGLRLIRSPRPLRTLLAAVAVAAGAALIDTAQIWAGLQAASEGPRHGGLSFAFAGSFSLPPENFITLLVPFFFGSVTSFPYWGKCWLWEVCVFVGLTGLTMAAIGTSVKFAYRGIRIAMVFVLLWIAIGKYSPLFWVLYQYVPGFSYFRVPAMFAFDATLFLAMLAGLGADGVLRSPRGARGIAIALLIGAIGLAALGAGLLWGVSGWSGILSAVGTSGESFAPPQYYRDAGFIEAARRFAASRCLIAAVVLLILAALFLLRASRPAAAYALVIFGVAEGFAFARTSLSTFPLASRVPAAVRQYLDASPGDYRTLGLENSAIAIGANDIWGYDPVVPGRYAQLVRYSQGGNPDESGTDLNFRNVRSPLLRLLGLRFVFLQSGGQYHVMKIDGGLSHLMLVGQSMRISDRDQIFRALSDRSFDPAKTAILESDPAPAPVSGGPPGTVRLIGNGADSMTIAADVVRPTLLLISDAYSRYWHAVALPGSSQSDYQVLPADYALIAVPLRAGQHRFRLDYAPQGYLIGRWISLGALVIYLVVVAMAFVRERIDT